MTTTERTRRESVWCCRWEWCGGIGVAGFDGGGEAMRCEACQAEVDAAATDAPPTGTDAAPTTDEVRT